ncbi:MAG: methionyl-tRNA formyltransferase [Eubacteriales bacterium]|nr:methionyl-tRNA formyltransferase [Eubacteriales bacterium]
MKVIFMGTPDFAVGTLEALIKAGHEVVAVVTQPDKPKGRGGAMAQSPVKEAAKAHGLTILQPVKARNPEFIEELRAFGADVIVVVAFGQILTEEVLNMTKYGCINVHASLLPKYRGAAPIQYAVIDGCEYSGVTTMQMDLGVDTGDILLTEQVKLDKKETGGSLFDRLSIVGADLLIKTLELAQKGELKPVKQTDEESSYVKMITKSMGELDFTQSAVTLERLIRGLNPWPSAYTHVKGRMLKVWDADVVSDEEFKELVKKDAQSFKEAEAGKTVGITKNAFYIKCGEGYLKINEVQLEGKKRMFTDAFLRGNGKELLA